MCDDTQGPEPDAEKARPTLLQLIRRAQLAWAIDEAIDARRVVIEVKRERDLRED